MATVRLLRDPLLDGVTAKETPKNTVVDTPVAGDITGSDASAG
jgi:hypothetical protein